MVIPILTVRKPSFSKMKCQGHIAGECQPGGSNQYSGALDPVSPHVKGSTHILVKTHSCTWTRVIPCDVVLPGKQSGSENRL